MNDLDRLKARMNAYRECGISEDDALLLEARLQRFWRAQALGEKPVVKRRYNKAHRSRCTKLIEA